MVFTNISDHQIQIIANIKFIGSLEELFYRLMFNNVQYNLIFPINILSQYETGK